ncbi:hypothetical protein QYM36_011804, partial [Artemia franciscana]
EVKGDATDLCKESVATAEAQNAVEQDTNTLDQQIALLSFGSAKPDAVTTSTSTILSSPKFNFGLPTTPTTTGDATDLFKESVATAGAQNAFEQNTNTLDQQIALLSFGTAKPDAVTTSTSTILSSPKFNFGLPTTPTTTGDATDLFKESVATAGAQNAVEQDINTLDQQIALLSFGTAKPDAVTTSTSTILSSPKFNFGLPTTPTTTGDATDLFKESVATAGAQNAVEQDINTLDQQIALLSFGTVKPDAVTTSISTFLSSPKFNFGLPTTPAPTGGFSFNAPDVSNLKIRSVAGAGEKREESRPACQFSFSSKIMEGVKPAIIQPSKLFAFGTPTGAETGEQNKPVTSVSGTSSACSISSIRRFQVPLEPGTAKYGTRTPVNLTITPITKTTSALELDKGTKPISSAIGASSAGSFQVGTTATPVVVHCYCSSFFRSTATATSTTAPTKPTGSLIQPKFTIGSSQLTPKLSEILTEEKKKEEIAKPNISAGFTFGSPKLRKLKPEDKTELKSDNGKKKREELTLKSILKRKDTSKPEESTGMLFSSFTGSREATYFKKTVNFKGFPVKDTPVFGVPKKEPTPLAAFPGSMEKKVEAPEEEVSEEFFPNAEFKPVIPLPDLVEVKTGEEEETELFCNQGILYCFDADSKEWKVKGRGNFKVLRHKKTGKVRFLMRNHELILKICCNHLITPELDLMPMKNSDKAFTWYAQDYSEGELKKEILALKFKLADTAKKLKQIVDLVKEELAKPIPFSLLKKISR